MNTHTWISLGKRKHPVMAGGLAAVVLGAGLAAGCASSQVPQSVKEPTAVSSQDSAGFAEALKIARQRYPDAPALGVEFETEDGRKLIEVSLWEGSEIRDVYVDPRNRTIVKEESQTPSANQARAILQTVQEDVKLEDAIDLALQEHSAKAVQEVGLQMKDNQLVIGVQAKGEDGTADWTYDANTKKVIKREKEGFMDRMF